MAKAKKSTINLKNAIAMPGKPFVLMYRSMSGFPGIHSLDDRSKIPLTLLYIRANGIFDCATAHFRINVQGTAISILSQRLGPANE